MREPAPASVGLGSYADPDERAHVLDKRSLRTEISCPSAQTVKTVVDCHDDPIVGERARALFRDSWPEAVHREISGGHYPYVNAPEEFARTVLTAI